MHITLSRLVLLSHCLLGALLTAGCSDSDDSGATQDAAVPRARIDAYAVAGTQLAVLDATADTLLRYELDTSATTIRAERVTLPPNPITLAARRGAHSEWLVLCAGLRGVDEPMRLTAVDVRGKLRTYPVSAPYTSFEQTEDGRFALLRFAQGARATAFPSAQLAIIDLDTRKAPAETSVLVAGSVPDAWHIAPPLELGDRTRHFALASGPQQVALLDLDAPDMDAQRVILSGDPARARHITAVAFDAKRARVALLAEALDDVVLLGLRADESARRGYTLEVSNVAVGRDPSAVAFPQDGSLVVLTDDGKTLITQAARTGERSEHSLHARAQELTTCSDCTYALLHTPLSREASLVMLENAVAGDSDAVQPVHLGQAATTVLQDGDTGHVGCVHEAGALTWFDLYEGTVFPLGVASADARAATAAEDGSVWFAPTGSPLLTHYDPASTALTEVLLRAPVDGFALVPKAGVAAVLHEGKSLSFTLVSDAEPSFERARYVRSVAE